MYLVTVELVCFSLLVSLLACLQCLLVYTGMHAYSTVDTTGFDSLLQYHHSSLEFHSYPNRTGIIARDILVFSNDGGTKKEGSHSLSHTDPHHTHTLHPLHAACTTVHTIAPTHTKQQPSPFHHDRAHFIESKYPLV